jgi:hypothetical protein
MYVQKHANDPHDGQFRQIGVQFAACPGHPRSTVADTTDIRPTPSQLGNQVGAVQIAAGFSHGEEDFHTAAILC